MIGRTWHVEKSTSRAILWLLEHLQQIENAKNGGLACWKIVYLWNLPSCLSHHFAISFDRLLFSLQHLASDALRIFSNLVYYLQKKRVKNSKVAKRTGKPCIKFLFGLNSVAGGRAGGALDIKLFVGLNGAESDCGCLHLFIGFAELLLRQFEFKFGTMWVCGAPYLFGKLKRRSTSGAISAL